LITGFITVRIVCISEKEKEERRMLRDLGALTEEMMLGHKISILGVSGSINVQDNEGRTK